MRGWCTRDRRGHGWPCEGSLAPCAAWAAIHSARRRTAPPASRTAWRRTSRAAAPTRQTCWWRGQHAWRCMRSGEWQQLTARPPARRPPGGCPRPGTPTQSTHSPRQRRRCSTPSGTQQPGGRRVVGRSFGPSRAGWWTHAACRQAVAPPTPPPGAGTAAPVRPGMAPWTAAALSWWRSCRCTEWWRTWLSSGLEDPASATALCWHSGAHGVAHAGPPRGRPALAAATAHPPGTNVSTAAPTACSCRDQPTNFTRSRFLWITCGAQGTAAAPGLAQGAPRGHTPGAPALPRPAQGR
jgi:hypothetical protein